MNDAEEHLLTVFSAALECGSAAERQAYLDRACADDPPLRQRVEALLRSHDRAGGFLGRVPGPAETAGDAPSEATGLAAEPAASAVIAGRYKLLERIGEGGMGEVHLAQQTEPIRRLVAVKLIKPGMDSRQVLARFEAERQALALMDHPNIAKVLDAGTTGEVAGGGWRVAGRDENEALSPSTRHAPPATPSGRPYFVMELVKGTPITRYCDENRLTPRERLELFLPVCQAVQHAHQKGVIHRDLKPSNVLVAPHDGRPVVKVIDFGIAKAVGQPLTDRTLVTGLGAVVGTPEYMSPEQAELNNLDIDTRSDIYGLGVLLYELLTGTTPLTNRRVKEAALLEILRVIREEEPPRPSARLSTTLELPSIAAVRGVEPARLSRLVRGELDWIVMKALEKDRNRRYETANGFAMDVQRYLADEPVQACPPSVGYKLRKFLRRNKGPVLAAAVFVLLLAAGIVGTTTALVRALAAERRARTERDEKEEARRQTRQALNTMTDEVLEDLLGRQPQLTEEHRAFLKKVLAYHAEFAAAKADDPVGRQGRAQGYSRVGLLHQRLGEYQDAETAYREALAVSDRLAKDFPDQLDFRRDLAASYGNLGNLLSLTGRPKEAEAAYRDALGVHRQLVAAAPDRPDLRQVRAKCQLNLGILLSDMGRPEEAAAAYRDALALLTQLAAELPHRADIRQELALGHLNLGIVFSDTNQPELAEAANRDALALFEKLVAEFPHRSDFRQDLATSHSNLGVLLRRTGRLEAAEAAYRHALDVRRKLAADFPHRPDVRNDLAASHNTMGNLLRATSRLEKAEVEFRDALALQKQLAAEFAQRPEFRRALAWSDSNLASLLRDTGRLKDAEAAFADALAIQQKLVADFQTVPDYHNDLASTLGNLAGLRTQRGDFAAAGALLDQALTHHQTALKANPQNPFYRDIYRNYLEKLAENRVGSGDHARAAAAADELAKIGCDPPGDTYNAACIVGCCVTLAEKDARLGEARRKELAQSYADRAMALLRQAVARGFKDTAHVKNDSQLEPLRAREDFKKLLADLEGKSKE
jgi:serine/threonine protein kinase/tetratricopeptide (TPR) repeat protein